MSLRKRSTASLKAELQQRSANAAKLRADGDAWRVEVDKLDKEWREEFPWFAGDGAMLVIGLGAAPVTAGWSLVATAYGGVQLIRNAGKLKELSDRLSALETNMQACYRAAKREKKAMRTLERELRKRR